MHVIRPGMLSTVQDAGRVGVRRHGIVRGGVMDTFALGCANILVGNLADAAGLECTISGPELRFDDARVIANGGFAPRAELDGVFVAPWTAAYAETGSVLRVSDSGRGCRAYVAISGGIDVPAVLRSRSTDLTAGFGGHEGRALKASDSLPLGRRTVTTVDAYIAAGRSMLPDYSEEPIVRILAAPETRYLGESGLQTLESESYEVSADSNRMGCRLRGPKLSVDAGGVMTSSPVAPGTVQLPPSGQPIVLMADAQTVGGYPRIAHVASTDLPLIAQLRPGHSVRFRWIGLEEAERLAAERRRDFDMLTDALRLRSGV